MRTRPPDSIRTDPLFPYTTRFGAGVPVSTCYRWGHQHAAFAEAGQEALAIGYDRLETALLDYALACVEAPPIDPEAADPEAIGRSLVTRLRERTISPAELQFAMAMLGRHEAAAKRSEEHTSELQSLMRISYAVFCLKKTKTQPVDPATKRITLMR